MRHEIVKETLEHQPETRKVPPTHIKDVSTGYGPAAAMITAGNLEIFDHDLTAVSELRDN